MQKVIRFLVSMLSVVVILSQVVNSASAQLRFTTRDALFFRTNSREVKTLWVKNYGSVPLTWGISGSLYKGANWNFMDEHVGTAPLAPGDSSPVYVSYEPRFSLLSDRTANCRIDIVNLSHVYDTLFASAVAVFDSSTAGVLKPDSVDFGRIYTGSHADRQMSFHNLWNHPVTLLRYRVVAINPSFFHVQPPYSFPHMLAAGDSITFNVRYAPDSLDGWPVELQMDYYAGTHYDSTANTTDTLYQTSAIHIQAQGQPQQLFASAVDFGQLSNYTILFKSITINNTSNDTLTAGTPLGLARDSAWAWLNFVNRTILPHTTKEVRAALCAHRPGPVDFVFKNAVFATGYLWPYVFDSMAIPMKADVQSPGIFNDTAHFYLFKDQQTLTPLHYYDRNIGKKLVGTYVWLNNTSEPITITQARLSVDTAFHMERPLSLPVTVPAHDSLFVSFNFYGSPIPEYDFFYLNTGVADTAMPKLSFGPFDLTQVPWLMHPVDLSRVEPIATSTSTSIMIEPNPSTGPVSIRVNGTPRQAHIEVVNELGKIVAVSNSTSWRWDAAENSPPVPNGVYIVRVTGLDAEGKQFLLKSNLILSR